MMETHLRIPLTGGKTPEDRQHENSVNSMDLSTAKICEDLAESSIGCWPKELKWGEKLGMNLDSDGYPSRTVGAEVR